jgi:hypothetical protein
MKMLSLFYLLVLCGCGVVTERGVYEGIRQQQEILRQNPVPDPDILPAYDKFKGERDKLKPPAPDTKTQNKQD